MPNATTILQIFLIASLLFPLNLAAQHGSHGGASGSGTAPAGGSSLPADNPDLTDFKRAIQLQANPFQVAQFRTASEDTAEALKLAHDFTQMAASSGSLGDIQNHANALDDAVANADLRLRKSFAESKGQCSKIKVDISLGTDVEVACQ